MPPPLILDPAQLDLSQCVADAAEIERHNPHRFEFRLLDAVVYLDKERGIYVGYHDVRTDAFWVRGHIPGRPLFPGVLMIEAAAQLASYLYHSLFPGMNFLGFTGVDGVKFRGVVEPPARLVVVGHGVQMKPRRLICATQGFVGETMVFEATITGMPV
jgi:3-hydroxyacyl-[acyl-carrier-protein] dehydratase